MKSLLPLKAVFLFMFIASFCVVANGQSLNGGSVSISSYCYSLSDPAPTVNSLADASGGNAPYVYQWQAKITPSQWVDVIGGTASTLSPGVLFGPTQYRRRVTDASGAQAYSNDVIFRSSNSFNPGNILLQNGGSPSILVNTAPALLASNSDAYDGSGLYYYTWETSNSAAGPWVTIPNATSTNYQPPVLSSIGNYCYRRKAIDGNCNTVAYSNIIEIIVANSIQFVPKDFSLIYDCVFPGYLPSFLKGDESYGGTPPYSYQWESKVGNGAWTVISGETGKSYQPPVLTQTTSYRRKASDAVGASGYSGESKITLATGILTGGIVASNITQLIAPNAPASGIINVASAGNAYNGSYFWEKSFDNGNTWASIPNYSESSYYTDTAPTLATCYRRGIHSYCMTDDRIAYTQAVCVVPALPLTPGTISSSNNSTCIPVGTSVGNITGTAATGGSQPYTYQWQKNDNGIWINIATANAASYTPPAINHNTVYRRQVTDGANTMLASNEISVNVQSTVSLKGGIVDGPIITCSNTAPGIINNIIDACGGGGTLSYSWEYATAGGGWNAISSSNAPTHNATSISSDTKFRRKVGDGCGNAAYSNEVEVFVYPAIEAGTIFPVSQTVCTNGATEALSLMQNCHYTNGTVSYQWQRASSLSGPWTNVSGGIQSFYQARPSATAYYRLKVTSTVCGAEAYSNVATIVVSSCTAGGKGLPTTTQQMFTSSLSTKGNMKVYPNPATQGQSVFVTVDGGDGNYKAILRGTDGRAYNCTVSSSAKGQLQVKLPQAMAKGTYLIQVSNSSKQWIERIVVQ